jgi:uncharacterized DUF497 family protein
MNGEHNIKFSDHALSKFEILKKHGLLLNKESIVRTIESADKAEKGYKNRFVALSKLDDIHVLRVVYEKYNNDILVITFYPARSSRYEKS